MANACIYTVLGIAAAVVVFAFWRSGHLIRCVFTSAVQGMLSLLAVNVASVLTGVTVAVNTYTLSAVTVFGLPGTISLVLLDALLR